MIENLIKDRRVVVFDIETDGLLDTVSTIFCIVCKEYPSKTTTVFRGDECYKEFLEYVNTDTVLVGHNILSYDLPVLSKLLKYKHPISKTLDTLLLSQLRFPLIETGHSLASWGTRLNFPKMDQPLFTHLSEEMVEYCIRDVDLTYKVFDLLITDKMKKYSDDCVLREHRFRYLMDQQERTGFYFDLPYATEFLAILTDKYLEIERNLQKIFPPTIIEMNSYWWEDDNGNLWKTKKEALDSGVKNVVPGKLKTKEIPFNPGSRQQIAERLIEKGWKPKEKTEKGHIIVNETILESVDIPEAQAIKEYLLLQKRVAQVKSWIKFCDPVTSRVHGRVMTLGTVSTRCSHNDPNVAQTPASYSPYGKECRTCWTVENKKDYRLLGCDASQLELRILAHYMKDEDYIKEILHGDIHTANQRMAGLETRDQAKTFIYALIYGAGPAKIASIIGQSKAKGKLIRDKFLSNVPSLNRVLTSVNDCATRTGRLRGLDGRYLQVRSLHAALNVLIQGGGAIVCKEWLIQIMKEVYRLKIDARPVANIHDEIQFEVHKDQADILGEVTKTAMKNVESVLNLNCPLDSDFKIGYTWAETH